LLTAWEDAGTMQVVRITGGTGDSLAEGTNRAVGGRRVVTGFGADRSGAVVAATVSETAHPSRLILVENGVERVLVDPNPDIVTTPGERFVVEGAGGPIDAWVYLPPGD